MKFFNFSIRCWFGFHDHGYRHWTKTFTKEVPVIEIYKNKWETVKIKSTVKNCQRCGLIHEVEEIISKECYEN